MTPQLCALACGGSGRCESGYAFAEELTSTALHQNGVKVREANRALVMGAESCQSCARSQRSFLGHGGPSPG